MNDFRAFKSSLSFEFDCSFFFRKTKHGKIRLFVSLLLLKSFVITLNGSKTSNKDSARKTSSLVSAYLLSLFRRATLLFKTALTYSLNFKKRSIIECVEFHLKND
jgi:hypothetical protein